MDVVARKKEKTIEKIIPEHYHKFNLVYYKENFNELPLRKPWNHVIKFIPAINRPDMICRIESCSELWI